ncbi:hypothetical protein ABZ915_43830 [Streptomyces sp. NPDC046915]|uniref:hypothetical protein n=1 Tax=Streptomyces sp. NPDC046915 TaxID=3155257 RepID=UPI003411F4D5
MSIPERSPKRPPKNHRHRRPGRMAGLVLLAAVTGCGVQPTGVIDAGEPTSGLTKGMRVYFASDTGLRGVSRPDREVTELGSTIKLLIAGPNASEQHSGLTNLVESAGTCTATGHGKQVTLDMPGTLLSAGNRLLNGQLVCSPARAQSVLEPDVRPDDVQVTLKPDGDPLGPYECSYFPTPDAEPSPRTIQRPQPPRERQRVRMRRAVGGPRRAGGVPRAWLSGLGR